MHFEREILCVVYVIKTYLSHFYVCKLTFVAYVRTHIFQVTVPFYVCKLTFVRVVYVQASGKMGEGLCHENIFLQ